MAQTKLEKLTKILKKKVDKGNINYAIPDLWNAWNYNGPEMRKIPSQELLVNPYRFYSVLIDEYILPHKKTRKNYSESLSKINNHTLGKDELGGDWVRKSVLYSTMIRTSSAWDHDRSFSLDLSNFNEMKETGTFVKTLALLPLLQKMGVDTLYLLPISRFSLKDKKGELGSPYGIANFFDLDPNLKESMTGKEMTLEEEFQALVEACHILDMRVVIDIIPRTNSVENDLVKDHPDWFYWIKASEASEYRVPYVDGISSTVSPKPEYMEKVYEAKDVQRHIKMFQQNPREKNPDLFEQLKQQDGNLMELIEQEFDLKIAPAFSDHINDVQPPWTDVTFFRMFLDHPAANLKFLTNKKANPYILFDSIKSNLFPGKVPNQELWDLLTSIIPYYQDTYGIDGARIDMGHALPKTLLQMIINAARKNDPDFAFIAEELNPDNAEKAQESGYNIIIGNGFWMEPRIWEKKFHKFVYGAKDIALPMFACAETHDTARIAGRDGGHNLARLTTTLNMLLPNLVPFINSGQEVYETQPMNTGVDCTSQDKFKLPQDDLFYGKLALFDKYAIHYLNHNRWELPDHLEGIKKIRAAWLDQITDLSCYIPLYFNEFDTPAIGVSYFNKATNKCLLVVANTNVYDDIHCNASVHKLREAAGNNDHVGRLLYSTYEFSRDYHDFSPDDRIYFHLGAGEVKVIEF
ncbi:MAG: alpha-amylase [Bacilli bacterium]|nr:alpha-amylase [Bacilli bacterium]MBN2876026.1 alpha-amylase [Bacilli bacterium]